MSWGTQFTSSIFIGRQKFQSVNEIDYALSSIERDIENCKRRFLMYAISTPSNVVALHEEGHTVYTIISQEVEELMEEYDDLIVTRYQLLLLKEEVNGNEDTLTKINKNDSDDE